LGKQTTKQPNTMASIVENIAFSVINDLYFEKVQTILNKIYENVKNNKTKTKDKTFIKNMVQSFRRRGREALDFPITLKILDIKRNKLTSIPELPEGLLVLDASSNKLTSLPELPASLKVLIVSNNLLTSLPELPEGLEVLYCDQNLLTSFPNIPTTLQILVGYNNCFTEDIILPKKLKFKNVQSRLILDKKHYGINKTEVDEFILNNSRINRSNCKCGKYITRLFKKYSEELSNEFKTFAYYYEDNRRCGDCDRHYTCGFCCKKYRIERPGHSFYFQG
jgi:Leucine-rich repeat (LRR) protein